MTAAIAALITAAAAAIRGHADTLTALDQAIGDGDHGVNLRRGFDAIAEQADTLAELPLGKALHQAGMTLVMKVGGASGPLYGSLLMAMGKDLDDRPITAPALADAFAAGIEQMKRRGRSDVGAKTMLDVLVPVQAVLRDRSARPVPEILAAVLAEAEARVEATRDMVATKGRASYLGERSRGHIDPGAKSSALLIQTVCTVIGEAAA